MVGQGKPPGAGAVLPAVLPAALPAALAVGLSRGSTRGSPAIKQNCASRFLCQAMHMASCVTTLVGLMRLPATFWLALTVSVQATRNMKCTFGKHGGKAFLEGLASN